MLGRGRSAAIRGYRRLMSEGLEEPYEKVESWGQAVKGGGGGAAAASAEPDGRSGRSGGRSEAEDQPGADEHARSELGEVAGSGSDSVSRVRSGRHIDRADGEALPPGHLNDGEERVETRRADRPPRVSLPRRHPDPRPPPPRRQARGGGENVMTGARPGLVGSLPKPGMQRSAKLICCR